MKSLLQSTIWEEYVERSEDIRHTPNRYTYRKRKETIERVFADAKEKHAMRYTNLRGLSQVTNWVRLKFAAMNLKKYAIHRWKEIYIYLYIDVLFLEDHSDSKVFKLSDILKAIYGISGKSAYGFCYHKGRFFSVCTFLSCA